MAKRGRMPRAWARKTPKGLVWYTTFNYKQVRLTKPDGTPPANKREAGEIVAGMVANSAPPTDRSATANILAKYLLWASEISKDGAGRTKRNISEGRLEHIRPIIKQFAKLHGRRAISDLRPHHAESWVAGKSWSRSTQTSRISIIRAAFNWAVKHGHISANPLKKYNGPGYDRRACHLTDEMLSRLQEDPSTHQSLKDICFALRHSGARPSEISRATAADYADKRITLSRHKTSSSKPSARVIWLTDELDARVQELAVRWPTGPLFRNARRSPWHKQVLRNAFARASVRLGFPKGSTIYMIRHLFITEALARGVDAVTVSTMVGTSVDILIRHYSNLMQRGDAMLPAVNSIKPR